MSTLGWEPVVESITLTEGADWFLTINTPAGSTLPAGTTVVLNWYNPDGSVLTSWPGTVAASSASWVRQSTDTGAAKIPEGTRYRIYLSYPDGPQTDDYCWYRGICRRAD